MDDSRVKDAASLLSAFFVLPLPPFFSFTETFEPLYVCLSIHSLCFCYICCLCLCYHCFLCYMFLPPLVLSLSLSLPASDHPFCLRRPSFPPLRLGPLLVFSSLGLWSLRSPGASPALARHAPRPSTSEHSTTTQTQQGGQGNKGTHGGCTRLRFHFCWGKQHDESTPFFV